MSSSLIVLLADSYHTEASCAVLGCLQQAERRRSGSRIKFVFNPTGRPEPGFLQGADGAVLVLLEGQREAAETMLRFWEQLAKSETRALPVLPIHVRTGKGQARPGHAPLPIVRASLPVSVVESDILIEHGGHFSLSYPAENEIEQALLATLRTPDSRSRVCTAAACPALKN